MEIQNKVFTSNYFIADDMKSHLKNIWSYVVVFNDRLLFIFEIISIY